MWSAQASAPIRAPGPRAIAATREQRRADEAVQGVVERDGARVEPALREPRADAEQHRKVGRDDERREDPPAAAVGDHGSDRGGERRGGEEPVGGSASGLGESDVHGGLLILGTANVVSQNLANNVSHVKGHAYPPTNARASAASDGQCDSAVSLTEIQDLSGRP